MRNQVLLAVACVASLAMTATAIPELKALDRYGRVIVAPSKVCGLGAPPLALDLPVGTLFSTDFDASDPAKVLTASSTNYWHVTAFAGQGVDAGHGGPNRLYYGVERPQGGSFNFGTTKGAVTFTQPIAIPATGETLITWSEKWEVEWGGFGLYDAMGVQLVASPLEAYASAGGPVSGPINTKTLCLSDPLDPVGQDTDPGTGIPSCSPNIFTPCVSPPAWGLRHEFVTDSYKGKTVHLRFNFDAMDSLYNDFLGWMVDDVNVITVGA